MSPSITRVPLEHTEDVCLKDWCEVAGIDLWKIPQETYTPSWNQKRKNKEAGVRPGISDSLIFVPADKTKCKKNILLFIEMKRQRRVLKNGKPGSSPSSVSPEQIDFLEKINSVSSVQGCVAYGAAEAVAFIKSFLN